MLSKIFDGKLPGISPLNLKEKGTDFDEYFKGGPPAIGLPSVEEFKAKTKTYQEKR